MTSQGYDVHMREQYWQREGPQPVWDRTFIMGTQRNMNRQEQISNMNMSRGFGFDDGTGIEGWESNFYGQRENVLHDGHYESEHGICSVQEHIPCAFRECFNFRYFNTVQSECFKDIFRKEQSVVVSAPTGSGKTTLFELAIVKLLNLRNTNESYFQHTPGLLKTVYLCPTKSLAQERVRDWTDRFGKIGVIVEEITGDSEELSAQRMDGVDIIVATPERFDAITRNRSGSKAWFNEVSHHFLY